ncbi:SacI homology domain-containing protein [Lactarius akahatsu]|uniref:SacI homology domain-containing protein n=1 Tax=Lactarius akahatsu TaxID=416441 RepID=A0AAD4LQJ8_9AGAM|nr:SacI homology domain-containing protein [Lactarius akahatsu]
MKRLFSKSPKSPSPKPPALVHNDLIAHTPALQPKFVVPAVPHPRPHDHIAVLPTQDGLLLRPHRTRSDDSDHYFRINWGKSPKFEEFQGSAQNVDSWASAVIVYGIVGILELFTESYLLLITSRSEVGHMLDESRKIYAVKDVAAVPLSGLQQAEFVINAVARRNTTKARGSLVVNPSLEQLSDDPGPPSNGEGLHVTFADGHQVKVMTPDAVDEFTLVDRSPSPAASVASSVASSASSETSGAPVAKALANRLSFWNRLSKRNSSKASEDESPSDVEEDQPLDALIHEGMPEPQQVLNEIVNTTAPPPPTIEEKYSELEAKILRQTVKEYAKGEMYFAYDFDLTRTLQHKQEQIAKAQKRDALLKQLDASDSSAQPSENVDALAEPLPTLPLWRRVDRQFWWNEHLSKPLTDAGLHPYVLPLVQGFFQIASFSIPLDPELSEAGDTTRVEYIIMSRRSRDRAGLRYQRRGVDDEAHVANFVETETVTRLDRENTTNIFSYVQIRGSIPLFWTQSGPGLKPAPQLSPGATRQQNLKALSRHFKRTLPTYGPHTIVNLAERHGREGMITNAYGEYVEEAQLSDVKYCAYDFHAETKGMKYENITKLITQLERSFESQGFLWISGQSALSQQRGVYRVNCIDCLDRTNVVQSAFARYVLNRQLLAVALLNPSGNGRTDMDVVFNDVWANNGDAISRCYAGTSALKGDFTRTGKRDLGGLLNDGINSLARMYTSTFSDWFCQAVIDYMLGFRTLSVFSEFLLKLQSSDPRELVRLSNIRAEAIATCVSRVLEEGEKLLSGWTLFSPGALNTKLGDKFEEKVLLLSAVSLHIIVSAALDFTTVLFNDFQSYDYNLEKVKISTRIPLRDIIGIAKGTYIVSPLEEASRDPIQNAGFSVEWRNARQFTRVTSYSVRNSVEIPASPTGPHIVAPATPTTSKFTGRSSSRSNSPTVSSPLSPTRPSLSPKRTSTTTTTTPAPRQRTAVVVVPVSPPPPPPPSSSSVKRRLPPLLSRTPTGSRLSRLLSSTAPPPPSPIVDGSAAGTTSFAAFKALPIDPARTRRGDDGSTFVEPADAPEEFAGASTCREAVDHMVDCIVRACADATGGGDSVSIVRQEDIVSLAEAQKMTSVYAKMEYGVKRLLWLGG